MSKLTKGYGSGGMQAILGDVKTYYAGELAKKANTSDLGTAASRNATNQIAEGSTALPEAGAVKTALDGKEESGVAETLVKDAVGWSGKNKAKDYTVNPTTEQYGSVLYVDIDFEPSTTYTISFEGTGGNGLYTNEDLVENLEMFTVASSGRTSVTFTTKSTLPTPSADGYLILKNSVSQSAANVFTDLMIELGSSATSYEPYHVTVDTVKADKVTNATSGHLAGLDSNGNLTDSGVSPTEDVTVEGNPVTFDSPFEQDAKSVVVSVKPIQDLHGYDHPWPIHDATFEILTDNADNVTGIKVNGTPSSEVRFSLHGFGNGAVFSENAIMTGCPSGGSNNSYKLYISNNTTSDASDTGNGVSLSPELFNSAIYNNLFTWIVISANYTATNLIFYPMIRLATESDATFAPYSNECPISGIDELKIGVTGKNLCEKTFRGFINAYSSGYKDIYIDNDSESAVFYAYAGQTYCLSSSITAERNVIGLVSTDNIVSGMPVLDTDSAVNNVWTAKWTGWTVWYAVTHVSADFEATCQIELGSTSTAYEPYKGSTTTIPLPSTLYDADVDVTNGDGTDNGGFAIFDGSSDEGWQIASDTTAWFYTNLNNVPFSSSVSAVMSNLFKSNLSGNPWDVEDNAWIRYGQLHVRPNSVISPSGQTAEGLAEFKAWLANNPLQVSYELATPTTLSFTPADVELLEGTNVVSTNGEKVAVTYKAGILATLGDIDDVNDKVKTKFDKKDVAKVEGANASKPYAVGDYILRSDGFYEVTQAIAQNAPITSNNTDKTTVGDELSSKVDTDDSRLSDARTPVAHTHNISDITGIPAWTKLGDVTGTSPDYANSSTFNLSSLQNKDVLMIFSVEEGTLTAKQGIITLEYSAFEFNKILQDSVQEEDEITRLWKGFYGGAPRESVATFEEFLRGLGYVYIATHSTTAEIGAKIYGAYDWTLEIYTK